MNRTATEKAIAVLRAAGDDVSADALAADLTIEETEPTPVEVIEDAAEVAAAVAADVAADVAASVEPPAPEPGPDVLDIIEAEAAADVQRINAEAAATVAVIEAAAATEPEPPAPEPAPEPKPDPEPRTTHPFYRQWRKR